MFLCLLYVDDNVDLVLLSDRAKPKIFLVGGHRDYFSLVGHCKIIIIVITIIIIVIIIIIIIIITITIITIHIMLYRNFRFVCILLCIIH